MSKVTIFDVAKHASVSIKTVSRVVNSEPNVRESTRQRVEKAIADLSYRPDQSARNLASRSSNLIGLIYDDPSRYEMPSGGYILDLQQGALKACRLALSELLIHPCEIRKRNVGAELKALIARTRLSGVILAAPLSNIGRIVRAIEDTGTPLVRLSPGRENGKQFCVTTNDFEVSAELTQYLAGLGHKRIAYIKGDSTHEAVNNRFRGYKEGLRAAGLKYSAILVAEGDNSFGSGMASAEKLLKSNRPPSAISAANDDMAAGVIRVANHMGIKIPQQLSVTGFDDIALARQVDPALTTIRQPLVRMAEQAVSLLIHGAGQDVEPHGTPNGTRCIPAKIKIRESTGPAPD
ncbi:MAG: LacI family DNA-binding transcriptional regulator [Woeseia sp.]